MTLNSRFPHLPSDIPSPQQILDRSPQDQKKVTNTYISHRQDGSESPHSKPASPRSLSQCCRLYSHIPSTPPPTGKTDLSHLPADKHTHGHEKTTSILHSLSCNSLLLPATSETKKTQTTPNWALGKHSIPHKKLTPLAPLFCSTGSGSTTHDLESLNTPSYGESSTHASTNAPTPMDSSKSLEPSTSSNIQLTPLTSSLHSYCEDDCDDPDILRINESAIRSPFGTNTPLFRTEREKRILNSSSVSLKSTPSTPFDKESWWYQEAMEGKHTSCTPLLEPIKSSSSTTSQKTKRSITKSVLAKLQSIAPDLELKSPTCTITKTPQSTLSASDRLPSFESKIADPSDRSSQFTTPPLKSREEIIIKPTPQRTPQRTHIDENPENIIPHLTHQNLSLHDSENVSERLQQLTSYTPEHEIDDTQEAPKQAVLRQAQFATFETSPFRPPTTIKSTPPKKNPLAPSATDGSLSTDRNKEKKSLHFPLESFKKTASQFSDSLPKTREELMQSCINTAKIAGYILGSMNSTSIVEDGANLAEQVGDIPNIAREEDRSILAGTVIGTAGDATSFTTEALALMGLTAPTAVQAAGAIGTMTGAAILSSLEWKEDIQNGDYDKAVGSMLVSASDTTTYISGTLIPLLASNAAIPAALIATGPIGATAGTAILTLFEGKETRANFLFHKECLAAIQSTGIREFLIKHLHLSQEERRELSLTQEIASIHNKRALFAKRTSEEILTESLTLLYKRNTKGVSQEEWIELAKKIELQSFENEVRSTINTALAAMNTTALALSPLSHGITMLVAGGITLGYVIGDGKNGYLVKKLASHCWQHTTMGKNSDTILMHMPIEPHVYGTPQRVGKASIIDVETEKTSPLAPSVRNTPRENKAIISFPSLLNDCEEHGVSMFGGEEDYFPRDLPPPPLFDGLENKSLFNR